MKKKIPAIFGGVLSVALLSGLLLFLLPSCANPAENDPVQTTSATVPVAATEQNHSAIIAAQTSMDGTGEIHVYMPWDDLEAKLNALGIPHKRDGYSVACDDGTKFTGTEDWVGDIYLQQTKEGLAFGDTVLKLKQLYPDFTYAEAHYADDEVVKNYHKSFDNNIVASITVSGSEDTDTVLSIGIVYSSGESAD